MSWNKLLQLPPDPEYDEEEDYDQANELEDEVADALVTLLKYNKQLQALDLSNTGLTTRIFEKMTANWSKASSLLSCNLSSNPFISEIEDYSALVNLLRAKPLLDETKVAVFKEQITACTPHS